MTEQSPEDRAYQEAWDAGYEAGYEDGSADVYSALVDEDDEEPTG